MTSNFSRDSRVIIKEAELLSSSNDFIYRFFAEYSSKVNDYIDEKLEEKLLLKEDPFIDILLAQYCHYDETIYKLFTKAANHNNLALKLACLSNETVGRFVACGNRIPSVLFGENNFDECPLTLKWFEFISDDEIEVLFSNKSIDDDWLTSLLRLNNGYWSVLSEAKQRNILRSLSKNPRVQTRCEDGIVDGDAQYHYNKLFYAIWDLAKTVPTTREWAYALGMLLDKVVVVNVRLESLDDIYRWNIDADLNSQKGVKLDLNPFEHIRYHLYRFVIESFSVDGQFNSDDIACRMCAYSYLKNIGIDDVKSIYKNDGPLGIEFLLRNDNLWMLEETREALKDFCYKSTKDYEQDFDCFNSYFRREKIIKDSHPQWFVDKIYEETNDDDKPVTLRMAREFIKESKVDITDGLLVLLNAVKSDLKLLKVLSYAVLAGILLILIN